MSRRITKDDVVEFYRNDIKAADTGVLLDIISRRDKIDRRKVVRDTVYDMAYDELVERGIKFPIWNAIWRA